MEHVFTHFALTLAVFYADAPQDATTPEGARWTPEDKLEALEALPTVMRKALVLARG